MIMAEVVTLRPCWQDGRPVPVGTVCSLSESDALYAESIGRVERVTAGQKPVADAPSASEPVKRGRGRPRTAQ